MRARYPLQQKSWTRATNISGGCHGENQKVVCSTSPITGWLCRLQGVASGFGFWGLGSKNRVLHQCEAIRLYESHVPKALMNEPLGRPARTSRFWILLGPGKGRWSSNQGSTNPHLAAGVAFAGAWASRHVRLPAVP